MVQGVITLSSSLNNYLYLPQTAIHQFCPTPTLSKKKCRPQTRPIQKYPPTALWNIQGGIQSAHDSHLLLSDFSRHKIDVAGLQETRCGDFQLLNEKGLLICLAAKPGTPPHLQYGQGFYVSPSWIPYYYGVKQISNRISIIQFQVNGPRRRNVLLSIINVYAPTSARISANLAEGDQFYEELTTVLEQYNRTSYITFILGDFNSKLGLKPRHQK